MIKFLSLVFLGLSYRVQGKIKNAVYRLEISALLPEIFKFQKCAKYANKRTDDVINSTQYNIKCINGAISSSIGVGGTRPVLQNWSDTKPTLYHLPANGKLCLKILWKIILFPKIFKGYNFP